jgi:hypothetical protein
MQTATRQLMTPISDIADALSFGLVGKIRKKAHSPDDIVQTNIPLPKNHSSLNCCHRSKSKSPSPNDELAFILETGSSSSSTLTTDFGLVDNLQRHNTITAAYNFNSAIIDSDINSYQKSLKRSLSLPNKPNASSNEILPSSFKFKSNNSSPSGRMFYKKSNDNTSTLDSDSTLVLRKKSSKKFVTISEEATNLVSGELISLTTSSTINQSTLDSTSSLNKSHTPTIKKLPKYPNLNYMDDDAETSSVLSLNSEQQYRLVLDDHIIPGMPSATGSKS